MRTEHDKHTRISQFPARTTKLKLVYCRERVPALAEPVHVTGTWTENSSTQL